MRRKISSIIISLLLLSSIIIFVNNDTDVKATSGGNGNESIDLYYDYIWYNITENLSNVVHVAYNDSEIRKGRAFGTKGEWYTVNEILMPAMNEMGLENVKKLPLGPITYRPNWEYTSKVETRDFNLTINYQNLPDYIPSDGYIPKNETGVIPSAWRDNSNPDSENWSVNYNNTFNNVKLVPKNFSEKWFLDKASTNDYLNVTNITILNELFEIWGIELFKICGLAEYIPINQTIPDLQICKIFLLEEENVMRLFPAKGEL